MNQLKQKLCNFDMSILLEKIKSIEEQQVYMYNLNKRPTYEDIQQVSQTHQILSDYELRKKFRDIQKDQFQSWKPELIPTSYCRSFAQTPNHTRIKVSPKNLEPKKKNENPLPQLKIRSKSTDQKQRTETKEIEVQFAETRNLIRRFNRIKKQVRFNIIT